MSQELQISKLESNDKIHLIQKLSIFTDHLDIEETRVKKYLQFNSVKNTINQVIKINDEIIGFYSYTINSKNLYISWIFFFKEYRKKGFGKKILIELEKIVKENSLEVIVGRIKEDNKLSQDFSYNNNFKELKKEGDDIIFVKYFK